MRILLVEDDPRIARALAEALGDRQYAVDWVEDGRAGLDYAEAAPYDLILLDVMLPAIDGIELCRRLRDRGQTTPILMLTARDASGDKVLGLDAGADDYVVKPFDLEELMARVRALLRRGHAAPSPLLAWRGLSLDPSSCDVLYRGNPLTLSRKEYALLELLLRNPTMIFNRAAILDRLWSFEDPPSEDAIKTLMRRLRQKLAKAGAPSDFIETVYGFGYRLHA